MRLDRLARQGTQSYRSGAFLTTILKTYLSLKQEIGLKKGNRQVGESVKGMGPANYVWRDQPISTVCPIKNVHDKKIHKKIKNERNVIK